MRAAGLCPESKRRTMKKDPNVGDALYIQPLQWKAENPIDNQSTL